MVLDDVRLELAVASRVGELEQAASLLRHRIRALSSELDAARGRIADLEMEAEGREAELSAAIAHAEAGAGAGVATGVVSEPMASTAVRARLWEAQQLAEARGGDLAGLRAQLKEKSYEVKAAAAKHAAAVAALERDRQAMSVELNISRERSKAAVAAKNKSLQELTLALQGSQQQVARLRLALQEAETAAAATPAAAQNVAAPSAASTSELDALRKALDAALRETREAKDEAAATAALLARSRDLLREREAELSAALEMGEDLKERLGVALAQAEEASAEVQALALTVETVGGGSGGAGSDSQPATAAAAASHINTKEALALLVEQHRRKLSNLIPEGSKPSSFGWMGRAQQLREEQGEAAALAAASGATEEELGADDLLTHDVSVDQLDPDDELALPALEHPEGGGSGGGGQHHHDSEATLNAQDQTVLSLTLGALLRFLDDTQPTSISSSKAEQRLQAEKDNLSYERDSYREEIMRFLEIDAAMSVSASATAVAASAMATEAMATPVGSPSKSDRSGGSRTPKRGAVDDHAIIASTVAAAASSVQAIYSQQQQQQQVEGSTPKRTMAIVRGFAESNGRLQAQVVSLSAQLEENRLLLQRSRQAEQVATLDLLRAEQHNQQLTNALNLALAARKDGI